MRHLYTIQKVSDILVGITVLVYCIFLCYFIVDCIGCWVLVVECLCCLSVVSVGGSFCCWLSGVGSRESGVGGRVAVDGCFYLLSLSFSIVSA
jgi:hypothetical protein